MNLAPLLLVIRKSIAEPVGAACGRRHDVEY
jgi:hypothetical protein